MVPRADAFGLLAMVVDQRLVSYGGTLRVLPYMSYTRYMNEPIVFAAAKCYKLDRSGLSRSESHGRRADLTSKNKTIRKRMEDRIRNDYDPATPRSYGWAMGQDDHTAIQAAFEEHQRVTGAKFWGSKNPRIALHFILVTSSAWVKETGNPYSPKNKRVQRLIDQAIAWGEKEFGKGSVFAARYDADEMSCGVVDLFVAPVRIPGGNRKHPHIMPNKAMAELQYRTKRRKSYEALQDSWAAHCQDVLDPVFVRGKPKKRNQDRVDSSGRDSAGARSGRRAPGGAGV